MEEILENSELGELLKAVQSLVDMDDESLTDEVVEQMVNTFNTQLVGTTQQTVNQIVQNLEWQGVSKQEAKDACEALIEVLKEVAYGDKLLSTNKQKVIDTIMNAIFNIFEEAIARYHSYSIELPLTLEEGAQVPTYAHETDAAADLYAADTVTLEPHTLSNMIRTGVHIQLPEGWVAFILPRSSIGAKTPLRLSNAQGVIDAGYRGPLGVLYDNIGDEPYTITAGDRIAQMYVMPSYRFKAKVVDSLEDSDRGSTGFGDSGK